MQMLVKCFIRIFKETIVVGVLWDYITKTQERISKKKLLEIIKEFLYVNQIISQS